VPELLSSMRESPLAVNPRRATSNVNSRDFEIQPRIERWLASSLMWLPGLSDRRLGLRRALLACQDPSVTELWVTHQERLARLGVGIIEELLSPHGGRVVAIGEDEALSDSVESELVRDMLAVVRSFSGRLYGQRSAKVTAIRRCVAQGTKS